MMRVLGVCGSLLALGATTSVAAPSIRIVSPAKGATLHSTVVHVELAVDGGFVAGRDGRVCVSVLWDKGKAGDCDVAATR